MNRKKIISFVKDYLKNVEVLSGLEKNDKILFLKDLFSELKWVLFESMDKEYNSWEFENRNEESTDRQKYTRLKIVIQTINGYNKKKKVTNKQLISLGSNIDKKKNKEEVDQLVKKLIEEITYTEGKYKEGYSFRDYLRDNNKLKELDNKSYIKQNKLLKIL